MATSVASEREKAFLLLLHLPFTLLTTLAARKERLMMSFNVSSLSSPARAAKGPSCFMEVGCQPKRSVAVGLVGTRYRMHNHDDDDATEPTKEGKSLSAMCVEWEEEIFHSKKGRMD